MNRRSIFAEFPPFLSLKIKKEPLPIYESGSFNFVLFLFILD